MSKKELEKKLRKIAFPGIPATPDAWEDLMRENEQRKTQDWYDHLVELTNMEIPQGRYDKLVRLHQKTLGFYLPAIQNMTEAVANSTIVTPGDNRTKAQVIAHIMAWEEWQIQVYTDPNKEERLKKQMHLNAYQDPDTGEVFDFANVDHFNAYQAEKYKDWKWNDIQERAINTAQALQSLFPTVSSPEWIDFLEKTPPHLWKLTKDQEITVPAGWYLWMVSLKHEAVEHREDLI